MTEKAWDRVAHLYDGHYDTPECHAEDELMLNLIGDIRKDVVLDVGCGTGWLLDHIDITDYTGLDPSAKMLRQLLAKHPSKSGNILQMPVKSLWNRTVYGGTPSHEARRPYDTILALYGAGAFLSTRDVGLLYQMLRRPNGKLIVSVYSEDQPMIGDWGFSEKYPETPEQIRGVCPDLSMGFHHVYVLRAEI